MTSGVKQLLLSMTNGIQALMGEMWAKQELLELNKFFGWIEWILHSGTILIFGITSVLIVPFVQVYTKGVSDVNYIQPLFAILIVLANAGHCLRLPYNMMILAGGHYKQTQYNYIIAAVLNILISVIAVKKMGLVGVAIGTVVAMFYQTIWMAWYDSKNLIKWPFKNFLKQLIIDGLIVVLVHLIINLSFMKLWFEMNSITYISWIILAVKVSLLVIVVSLIINIIFYRMHVRTVVAKCMIRVKN